MFKYNCASRWCKDERILSSGWEDTGAQSKLIFYWCSVEMARNVLNTVACILSRVAPMACAYLFFFRDQLQNDEKITSIHDYILKYKRVIQLNPSSTFSVGATNLVSQEQRVCCAL